MPFEAVVRNEPDVDGSFEGASWLGPPAFGLEGGVPEEGGGAAVMAAAVLLSYR